MKVLRGHFTESFMLFREASAHEHIVCCLSFFNKKSKTT